MNASKVKQVWLLLNLWIIATAVASPSETFLDSIITQLQQSQNSQFQPYPEYRSLSDELFGTYSRSAEEYENPEAQEPSENSLHQQNLEYDQSQYQILQQLNALQHQAHFAAGNQLNLVGHDEQIKQPPQQSPIIGLQQFNVNGYLNLPPPVAPAEVTEPSQDVAPQNSDPVHFAQNDAPHPVPVSTFDPQLLIQHLTNLQNAEQPTDVPQNNLIQVPAYYFHNPNTQIDENLIEDPYNAGFRPLEGEHLLGLPPGKKLVIGPLFVAMAGFVGIAMIFMSAVLFLPKILSSSSEVPSLKGPQELVALTKLAVETIEGNDCSERIACEVGRAMRSVHVASKPIKVLEVLLPANIAKQLAQIRKAVANEKSCRLIQCKSVLPIEQKSKLVESKIVADLVMVEATTKRPGQKQKGKTETPATTKSPKQSTKMPDTKVIDKKQHKDAENKLKTQSKDTNKKAADKKVDEKKPRVTQTKATNDTDWDFSFFG